MIDVMEKVAAGDIGDLSQEPDLKQKTGGKLLEVLLLCYAWGLLASLTPCVYPMIPTTLALFAGEGAKKSLPVAAATRRPVSPARRSVSFEAKAAGDAGDAGDARIRVGGEAGEEDQAGVRLGGDAGAEDIDGGGASASRLPIVAKALLYSLGISGTYTALGIIVTVAL
jgi:cytochrome c biogenesis protein CcdA